MYLYYVKQNLLISIFQSTGSRPKYFTPKVFPSSTDSDDGKGRRRQKVMIDTTETVDIADTESDEPVYLETKNAA
jgi:hypothetical protein